MQVSWDLNLPAAFSSPGRKRAKTDFNYLCWFTIELYETLNEQEFDQRILKWHLFEVSVVYFL